jgi:hypothetical protein
MNVLETIVPNITQAIAVPINPIETLRTGAGGRDKKTGVASVLSAKLRREVPPMDLRL